MVGILILQCNANKNSALPENGEKQRVTRIYMQSMPTQQYRRQAVRDNLDIVGLYTNETSIPNEFSDDRIFEIVSIQYPLAALWDYFWEPAF